MKAIQSVQSIVKESYIAIVIGLLGIFAFISAVLIAYPALAYLGSKLYM